MKTSLVIGTIAILTMGSATAIAAQVGTMTTFQSGTPAKASEVNGNFTAVKDAANDNDARITANEAAISANQSAITANDAAATANAAAIATKADAADVTANAANIQTNTTNIGANSLAIGVNTSNISTNTADIATNAANTTNNTADISALQTGVANNSAAISTNTTNINANASDIADIIGGNITGGCVGNDSNDIMVRVGPLCVDKYEASVWSTGSGGTEYGTASNNYPDSDNTNSNIGCNDNGNGCSGAAAVTAGDAIYARSQSGVLPSRYITWFQAQQACANSGKRLLTNAEWQMAVAGTPDNSTDCTTTGGTVGNTNAKPNCVSNWGVVNMIGNAAEWVADWIQGNGSGNNWNPASGGSLSANFNGDGISGVNQASAGGSASGLPAAIFRGGDAGDTTRAGAFFIQANASPAFSGSTIGFRCAR